MSLTGGSYRIRTFIIDKNSITNMPKSRRTKNSKLSTRGLKSPKIIPRLFQVQTFKENPSRGYSGFNAIKRILVDVVDEDTD